MYRKQLELFWDPALPGVVGLVWASKSFPSPPADALSEVALARRPVAVAPRKKSKHAAAAPAGAPADDLTCEGEATAIATASRLLATLQDLIILSDGLVMDAILN